VTSAAGGEQATKQTRIAALFILIIVGVGVYCANLWRTTRRLSSELGRLEQERLLRDWLFQTYADTFLIPPSKGVQIRLAFTVRETDESETKDEFELLFLKTPSDQKRECTWIKHYDASQRLWRCGFIIREGDFGSAQGLKTIADPRLTSEEIGKMLGHGPNTFVGFGSQGGGSISGRGRKVTYWYEVSE
jgi:hypothetical protein